MYTHSSKKSLTLNRSPLFSHRTMMPPKNWLDSRNAGYTMIRALILKAYHV